MNVLEYLLEKYPNKPWDWSDISANPNITMEIIEKCPDKPWEWDWISRNPNITIEIIEKYPDKPWNWSWLSRHPNLTMKIIEKYIDKIEFKNLSKNKFTYENKLLKKKELYWLLEEIRAFNKTENLVILERYM